ncbi:hypothetical protein XENTR_v10015437 [Xenopus tropicalis]|nr:hypothetical protein XENTR_v10015437 [Xenopus tropicalis]
MYYCRLSGVCVLWDNSPGGALCLPSDWVSPYLIHMELPPLVRGGDRGLLGETKGPIRCSDRGGVTGKLNINILSTEGAEFLGEKRAKRRNGESAQSDPVSWYW